MRSIFAQYGALATPSIETTATPSIDVFGCVSVFGSTSVEVSVQNNDALTASVEVSLAPDFSNSETQSLASNATGSFSLPVGDNPPGSTTVYARATASGKLVSTTASRTQNLVFCTF